ncbi:MAG TPA: glycogen debranching N-terminal domain-containing protein [Stellaceae bacterium]|jgi:glycogen debranching enzyme|nr:glycogen debranching N-terminal domain-containing protein [Stellaceae bacterium]
MTAAGEVGGISSFDIPVTASTAGNGRHVLKNANSFAVFDEFGQIQASGAAAEGLFFEDTRYLSRLAMLINGARPLLLSSTVTEGNTMLSVDLANPEATEHSGLAPASIHVLNEIALGSDALFATINLRNYGREQAELALTLELDADFVDLFEVRGTHRARRGLVAPVQMEAAGPIFAYRGLDKVTRRTVVAVEPKPQLGTGGARWELNLAPGENWTAQLEVHCERDDRPVRRSSRSESSVAEAAWSAERRAQITSIASSNAMFDEWLRCSRGDLDMLTTRTAEGLYPYAGVPWFSTAFGRDGLITALECLWIDPDLAAGTLRFLAANQATAIDPKADAEPGKILHETRLGEMAVLGEVPFGRYYGTVDATPLFVMLAAAYYERTGEHGLIADLWPHIEAALGWMETYGDVDGDGFIEYRRKSQDGLDNQGWKDSSDSIFHADGSLAAAPIALAEVQGYAYAAYTGAAALASALDRTGRAAALTAKAKTLRDRFDAAFWLEELGTYALALDGAKHPLRVVSSNAGHALFGGIARQDRASRVGDTLLSPASYSGWGIRTIAAGEARYNPMSYHNGSVWPHDNGLIALGFARYGLKTAAMRVLDGLFGAAQSFALKRLPELFCGFSRRGNAGPTAYPVACAPQAWSAASVFALLAASLGISFVPHERQIRFFRPVLPTWLPELRLTNLRLGEASVDLVLRCEGSTIASDVTRRDGPIEIVVAY